MKISDWQGKQDLSQLANSPQPKLVLFAAHWCGYCSRFLELANEYKDPQEAEMYLVDADDPDESIWDDYKISLVPTLAVLKSGNELFRKRAVPGTGLRVTDLEEALRVLYSN